METGTAIAFFAGSKLIEVKPGTDIRKKIGGPLEHFILDESSPDFDKPTFFYQDKPLGGRHTTLAEWLKGKGAQV